MFAEIAENQEDYKKFYEQFSKNLKLGIHEDTANRTKVADLLRFSTSKSGDDLISLKEYIARMKEGQNGIFYITGESKASTLSTPSMSTWFSSSRSTTARSSSRAPRKASTSAKLRKRRRRRRRRRLALSPSASSSRTFLETRSRRSRFLTVSASPLAFSSPPSTAGPPTWSVS